MNASETHAKLLECIKASEKAMAKNMARSIYADNIPPMPPPTWRARLFEIKWRIIDAWHVLRYGSDPY